MRRTDFCHPYNYVHPHLARSRLASLVTQRGRPTETKAPYDTIGGPSVSRHSKTASADRRCVLTSSSNPSRAGDTSVGVSSHDTQAIEPLTPLSQSSFTLTLHRASLVLHVLAVRPRFYGLVRVGGCEDGRDHRLRLLVKADASS